LLLGLNVTCFQATEQSVVHPLDDGLLVLGGDALRALSAEWTLIVAVDSPEPPTNLLEEIQNLKTATSSNYVLRNVDNSTVKMWRQQLERMESQVLSFGTKGLRHKRSILGFLV
jgi:molybdopterin-guanine dinucleotide biosynthesis protein A